MGVQLAAVDEALSDHSDQMVVEVGCGTGRLVDHLAGRGARVLGIDPSAGMLAVAATRVPDRLVCADARRLPLPDAIADAAITVATLEFTDAAAALAELARITRPGGRMYLSSTRAAHGDCSTGPAAVPRTRRPPTLPATTCGASAAATAGPGCGVGHSPRRTLVSFTTSSHSPQCRGRTAPWLGAVQVLIVDKPT
ncbi:MAG TPA: class I SAM-dependent methyltransferase [Mycobacterium sp.]|nr:class I SAM-dependent methyltransferase [Mycobacterium sp.]